MATILAALSPWRARAAPETVPRQSVCWMRFLDAAAATAFYSSGDYPALLQRMRSLPPPRAVTQARPLALEEYYRRCGEFKNPRAVRVAHPLRAQWAGRPRTLAVRPWFHPGCDILAEVSLPRIEAMRPECLAAPVDVLRHLARAVLSHQLRLCGLSFGVVALTGIGQTILSTGDRDLLWGAFQVPVYEQFRGFHGELLAWECERHEGLHFDEDAVVWESVPGSSDLLLTSLAGVRYPALRLETGLRGEIASGQCGCGIVGPRLFGMARCARTAAAGS